jgi:hypothetical protein
MMEFIEYVRANFMQMTSPLRDGRNASGMIIYVLTTSKAGTRCTELDLSRTQKNIASLYFCKSINFFFAKY